MKKSNSRIKIEMSSKLIQNNKFSILIIKINFNLIRNYLLKYLLKRIYL